MVAQGIARLTSYDLSNLRLDSPATPFHFGGLAIVDGSPLVDESGRLRLDEIRTRIGRRLERVPELRRRVHFPGLLRGRALWVDDDSFDIGRHVLSTRVDAPGGEAELLAAAAALYQAQLDHEHPLWELWFLTGLREGRVGVFLKLHHSVADGMAAVAIMSFLFDFEPDAHEPPPSIWLAAPMPGSWTLLMDNLSAKLHAIQAAGGAVAHPGQLASRLARFVDEAYRMLERQPPTARTSFNRVVKSGRVVRVMRLELDAVKALAHAGEATVNDVALDLVAGGLRGLLESRAESTQRELGASVAISLRTQTKAEELGNDVGVLAVRLPVFEADPTRRLSKISEVTRTAKAEQHPEVAQLLMGWLAATPLARLMMARQRAINVFTTDLVGPPVPVYILGAKILDVMPIVQVSGNVTLAFCMFSYCGRLNIVVTGDSTAVPDIDVIVAAMENTWEQMKGAGIAGPFGLVQEARGIRP